MSAPARSTGLVITLGAVLLLGVRDERPRTAFASYRKDDTPAYKGAGGDPSMAKSWAPGDHMGWENRIRARGRYQDEYNKTS